MDHPKPPTDAMILGSAVDCLVFSPTWFNSRFAVAEQCYGMTQKKQRCTKTGIVRFAVAAFGNDQDRWPRHWYCSSHNPVAGTYFACDPPNVLTADQSSTAYAMAKAVLNHPGASILLDACEETQLSLAWRENNLLCKGRLDGLSSELKTIVDLKTCADASPEAFSRKIADMGYHRQAAMYMRGATFHSIDVKNYVIIAVESEPPRAVALYSLTEKKPDINGMRVNPSPVEYGNHQLMRLLDLYERCEATGEWPSYPTSPVPISLPAWAANAIERE